MRLPLKRWNYFGVQKSAKRLQVLRPRAAVRRLAYGKIYYQVSCIKLQQATHHQAATSDLQQADCNNQSREQATCNKQTATYPRCDKRSHQATYNSVNYGQTAPHPKWPTMHLPLHSAQGLRNTSGEIVLVHMSALLQKTEFTLVVYHRGHMPKQTQWTHKHTRCYIWVHFQNMWTHVNTLNI